MAYAEDLKSDFRLFCNYFSPFDFLSEPCVSDAISIRFEV